MKEVEPQIFLVGSSGLELKGLSDYLVAVDGSTWWDRRHGEGGQETEMLVEFGGRLCYRSWEPGLNPNVKRVRAEAEEYFRNLIKSRHGSVTEHVSWSFVFHNVSRVFTHELVRHRVGVAMSQESLRYVRLTKIPFWLPPDVPELHDLFREGVEYLEQWQERAQAMFDWDKLSFAKKKAITSALRRLAPIGLATGIMWTANARTLRHTISMRTSMGAEVEIRIVFNKLATMMKEEAPNLFLDATEVPAEDGGPPEWKFEHDKI